MLTTPLAALLIIYGFFLLGFAVFSLINIGHFVSTGTLTFSSFVATVIFLFLAVFTLWSTWALLSGVDWGHPITIWNSGWLSDMFSGPQTPF